MIRNFQVKSISIGIVIGHTDPVITWYRTNTKICSIAHPYSPPLMRTRTTESVVLWVEWLRREAWSQGEGFTGWILKKSRLGFTVFFTLTPAFRTCWKKVSDSSHTIVTLHICLSWVNARHKPWLNFIKKIICVHISNFHFQIISLAER